MSHQRFLQPRKPIAVHSVSPGLVVDAGLAADREERLGQLQTHTVPSYATEVFDEVVKMVNKWQSTLYYGNNGYIYIYIYMCMNLFIR